MLYNKEEHSRYVLIAGRISIAAAVIGFAVFMVAFLIDVGSQEFNKVQAQGTATTTLTVLNTPPAFALNAFEFTNSATTTPINTSEPMIWQAIGTDSNNAPYFLLVCSTNATPTANAAADAGSLGTAAPDCSPTSTVQWGVSAATPSGSLATVSTTTATTAVSQFDEVNEWFAWVCDDDPFNPRCNVLPVAGPTSTSASTSPFHVNNRPVLTSGGNNGPVDPGGELVFNTVSTDPDTAGGADTLEIIVCQNPADYSTSTNSCPASFVASTTVPSTFTSNVAATTTLAAILQDDTYNASIFLIDEHGHEAFANPVSADFVVNNVAPQVLGSDISLNTGGDMSLTVPGGETTGFDLSFTIRDANSCQNAALGDEITGFNVAIFRSDLNSTTTCDATAGTYDPNDCYPSQLATTTWNLSCTASSTCGGALDDTQDYNCTFPLWFVADPTDNNPGFTPAANIADNWIAAVAGIDDNASTSDLVETDSPVDVISFTAIDLDTAEIPYGALEPGDDSGTLSATTSVLSVGNTGLDQSVQGESMCGTYTVSTECPVSATSTIPESEQQFADSQVAYGAGTALSSSSPQELELDVAKTTSTSTPNNGVTFWGISVPLSITLAGSYQGLNTFTGVTAEEADW